MRDFSTAPETCSALAKAINHIIKLTSSRRSLWRLSEHLVLSGPGRINFSILKITQPPRAVGRFVLREPAAQWVERCNEADLDSVGDPEGIAEIWRIYFAGAAHGVHGIEDEAEGSTAIADVAHDAEQDVNRIEMQDKVEQRDAAEDDKRIAGRKSNVVVLGKQQ